MKRLILLALVMCLSLSIAYAVKDADIIGTWSASMEETDLICGFSLKANHTFYNGITLGAEAGSHTGTWKIQDDMVVLTYSDSNEGTYHGIYDAKADMLYIDYPPTGRELFFGFKRSGYFGIGKTMEQLVNMSPVASISANVIYDDKGVKVYFTGKSDDTLIDYCYYQYVIENNTESELSVEMTNVVTNGWNATSTFDMIAAKSKAKEKFMVKMSDVDVKSSDEIEEFVITLRITDRKKYSILYEGSVTVPVSLK